MAQGAVNDYLTNVSENTLLKEQDSLDMRRLRQQLLSSALDYYRRFVNQRSKDPRLKKELASAYFRLGKITREIGSASEATQALESARATWEQLVAAEPGNDQLKGELGACYLAISQLKEYNTGDLQSGLKLLERARALLEPLAARHPDVATYQTSLADTLSLIGVVLARQDAAPAALDVLNQARTILHKLIERAPDQFSYKRSLTGVINSLGYVHYKKRDYPAALESFREQREICQGLLDALPPGPKPVWLQSRLATADYNMGTIYLEKRDIDQALRSFERSLGNRRQLAEAHPSVTDYRESLGESYREIANLLRQAHQNEKALGYIEKAVDIFERVVQSNPDEARFHSALALSWNALGCLHDDARDNARAIPEFERAAAEQERAARTAKDVSEYKAYLNTHWQNVGEQYLDMGQLDAGLGYYNKGIQLLRELHAAQPENAEYSLLYVDALLLLGNVQRHAGELAAGLESFAEASQLLDRLAANEPGNAATAARLARALMNQAAAAAEAQGPAAAQPLLARALEVSGAAGYAGRRKFARARVAKRVALASGPNRSCA